MGKRSKTGALGEVHYEGEGQQWTKQPSKKKQQKEEEEEKKKK